MKLKRFPKHQDQSTFLDYVFDNLLPPNYDSEDLSDLEDLVVKYQTIVDSLSGQIESLKDYAAVCMAGIDKEQVRSIANARSAHKLAISVMRRAIAYERRQRLGNPIIELQKQIDNLKERLDRASNSKVQVNDLEQKLKSVNNLQEKLKKTTQRQQWYEDRIERMLLLLIDGKVQDVKEMLWYWQKRIDTCGTLRFDEYIKALEQGTSVKGKVT